MPIGVLIADDHALVRTGLRLLFQAAGITVVAETGLPCEVVDLALDPRVQLVVLDILWISRDESEVREAGFELLPAIRQARPEMPVVMYSIESSAACIERCRQLGASGFLVKGLDDALLVPAVQAVLRGEPVWPDAPAQGGNQLAASELAWT